MSGTQLLRLLVNERLAAAAEEIFVLVEKTVAEYQDEVVRSKREIIQLKQEIEQLSVLKPEVTPSADSQPVSEEALPSWPQCDIKVDRSPSLEEEEIREPPEIKEEEEDLCIIPDLEAGTSNSVKVGLAQSEATAECQLFPSSSAVTVSVNDDLDDECNDSDTSSSSDLIGHTHGYAAFMEKAKAQRAEKACRFCGKPFYKYCDLIRHVDESHAGEKAFKCPECDKEFARRDHLVVHLRVHTGVKPHHCPLCGKSFAQSSNLNVHMRTHTGEKPYFCNTCGKMVAHSYHLKTCAMAEPKREKPFRCIVCGKKFHTVPNLRVHMRIHDARKPYTIV